MIARSPPFWWRESGWRAGALAPMSFIYGAVAERRMRGAPRDKAALPVICVGNFTVGGSGKTPVAMAIAQAALRLGRKPGFLTRGHGGSVREPHLVDLGSDDSAKVGDEPLLLAAHAPVAVARDRAAGARLLDARGCDFLIMDDGFQSARIHMDYALILVDAGYGVGNGRVLPAGPLRAPLAGQVSFADAVLRVGEGNAADPVLRAASAMGKPIFEASVMARDRERLAGRRFLAFAGIGHPEKFFQTLRRAGAIVAETRPFPDHHPYSRHDLEVLLSQASHMKLDVVTTAKDAVRIEGLGALSDWLAGIETLEIDVVFEPAGTPATLVEETLRAWRMRAGG